MVGFGSTTAGFLAIAAVLVPRSVGVAQFDENVMASTSALRQPVLTTVVQTITDLGA